MQVGEVIRKYRKTRNMTQEEMAERLGVTAPAVNKWEKGNSLPDISLLAPIARLLDITVDTLLSFQEELTAEEIKDFVYEVDAMFKEKPYEEVFRWVKRKLTQYPNCRQLIWQLAVILDAQRMTQEIPDAEKYDDEICVLYTRALESDDEILRSRAADSLFGFYMRKKRYDKAEEYLRYFSEQNPEKKRKQAQLFGETDRVTEAYRTYEEMLFAEYGRISLILHGMYTLALREKQIERAHLLADKQAEMAKCFEMGRYYEVSAGLELACLEKDADAALFIMKEMLDSVGKISEFSRSPLYEHMEFSETRKEFAEKIKDNLLKCFCDEENFGFLKEDARWKSWIKKGENR